MDNKLQVIAYYLPQFHAIPENDEWWGKGFTEWVNVKKAKPLFKGHNQPKVPSNELGYYNLLDQSVQRKQGELARAAGVTGFCYWHYWFGNGAELLEKPFRMVLADKDNTMPFCLGWANESWKAKQWRKDGLGDKILIEQVYSGDEDYENHFFAYLEAFKDPRYIKIEGKPVFLIYRPHLIPDLKYFISFWNKLAIENGLDGFYFIASLSNDLGNIQTYRKNGCNAVTNVRMNFNNFKGLFKAYVMIKNFFLNRPMRTIDYDDTITRCYTKQDVRKGIIPAVYPNWDHSARSGKKCTILHNSNPNSFGKQVRHVLKLLKGSPVPQILFIKSWNEWGEGNYMEPDAIYGHGCINSLHESIKEIYDQE